MYIQLLRMLEGLVQTKWLLLHCDYAHAMYNYTYFVHPFMKKDNTQHHSLPLTRAS